MDGIGGLAGWRWIFIVEGLATIALAPLTALFMPADVSSARFLNEMEREVAGEAPDIIHLNRTERGT